MPCAAKRSLSKEKNNKECAKKCHKIDSFFKATHNAKSCSKEVLKVSPFSVKDDVMIAPQLDDTETESVDTDESENIDDEDVGKLVQKEKDIETSNNANNATYLYRGFSLGIRSIIQKAGKDILSSFKEKNSISDKGKKKTRAFVRCLVCHEFEEGARKFSAHRRVYMAAGVRGNGKKGAGRSRSSSWCITYSSNGEKGNGKKMGYQG